MAMHLLCGLYVNELLERLLQPFDSHPKLYVYYQYVLNELVSGEDIEGALRTFEHRLLDELGVLPELKQTSAESVYCLNPGAWLCFCWRSNGEKQGVLLLWLAVVSDCCR